MSITFPNPDIPKPDPEVYIGDLRDGAVQLLREMVEEEPWNYSQCHFCGNWHGDGHASDCTYAKAQAFIATLDVK